MASMMAPSLALDGAGRARGRSGRRHPSAQCVAPGRRRESSTRASSHRPPSTGPASTRRGRSCSSSRVRPGDRGRLESAGFEVASGRAATTTSAASAPSRGTAPRAILVEAAAARLGVRLEAGTHPAYPHSGHPGFSCTVPPPAGFVYENSQERHRTVSSVGLGLGLPCRKRFRHLRKLAVMRRSAGRARPARQLYVGLDLLD